MFKLRQSYDTELRFTARRERRPAVVNAFATVPVSSLLARAWRIKTPMDLAMWSTDDDARGM